MSERHVITKGFLINGATRAQWGSNVITSMVGMRSSIAADGQTVANYPLEQVTDRRRGGVGDSRGRDLDQSLRPAGLDLGAFPIACFSQWAIRQSRSWGDTSWVLACTRNSSMRACAPRSTATVEKRLRLL